jgi:peptidoglycan biosynthesis protein MviN/MurJ (putative lipid II flippase)
MNDGKIVNFYFSFLKMNVDFLYSGSPTWIKFVIGIVVITAISVASWYLETNKTKPWGTDKTVAVGIICLSVLVTIGGIAMYVLARK